MIVHFIHRILGARVSELEQKLKTLEMSLWDSSVDKEQACASSSSISQLRSECLHLKSQMNGSAAVEGATSHGASSTSLSGNDENDLDDPGLIKSPSCSADRQDFHFDSSSTMEDRDTETTDVNLRQLRLDSIDDESENHPESEDHPVNTDVTSCLLSSVVTGDNSAREDFPSHTDDICDKTRPLSSSDNDKLFSSALGGTDDSNDAALLEDVAQA